MFVRLECVWDWDCIARMYSRCAYIKWRNLIYSDLICCFFYLFLYDWSSFWKCITTILSRAFFFSSWFFLLACDHNNFSFAISDFSFVYISRILLKYLKKKADASIEWVCSALIICVIFIHTFVDMKHFITIYSLQQCRFAICTICICVSLHLIQFTLI